MSKGWAGALVTGVLLAAGAHGHVTGGPHVYTASALGGLHVFSGPHVPSGNRALGERMAAEAGFTGAQWDCLDTLWEGESGWSQYADTRRSGLDAADATVFAYGIPQARPATKMPRPAWPAGLGGSSDPRAQIAWGLRYITATYGTPCAALAFKRAHGNQGY